MNNNNISQNRWFMKVAGESGKLKLASRDVEQGNSGLTEVKNLRANDLVNVGGQGSVPGYLPKYLRHLTFEDSYVEEADKYYQYAEEVGYCSARRFGNTLERNYDWYYDESCEFVVTMKPGTNSDGTHRYGSVGVAAVGKKLSEQLVASGEHTWLYKALPGMTLDGVNENGVSAEINVVHVNGSAWEHKLDGDSRTLNALGGVRWILDHARTAKEGAEFVRDHVYMPPALVDNAQYALHFLIADQDETYIVEDGVMSKAYTDKSKPVVMTNFRLLSEEDPFGAGYERSDILTAMNEDGSLKNTIMDVWYTKGYDVDENGDYPWPTEFAGCLNESGEPITQDKRDELNDWAKTNINGRKPNRESGSWWQTVHSSIYDLRNKTLKVAVQEQDDWYKFVCPQS